MMKWLLEEIPESPIAGHHKACSPSKKSLTLYVLTNKVHVDLPLDEGLKKQNV